EPRVAVHRATGHRHPIGLVLPHPHELGTDLRKINEDHLAKGVGGDGGDPTRAGDSLVIHSWSAQ
ncbi:hypothetical protein Q604_UNBC07401G0001, partial [human gut metagenome]